MKVLYKFWRKWNMSFNTKFFYFFESSNALARFFSTFSLKKHFPLKFPLYFLWSIQTPLWRDSYVLYSCSIPIDMTFFFPRLFPNLVYYFLRCSALLDYTHRWLALHLQTGWTNLVEQESSTTRTATTTTYCDGAAETAAAYVSRWAGDATTAPYRDGAAAAAPSHDGHDAPTGVTCGGACARISWGQSKGIGAEEVNHAWIL